MKRSSVFLYLGVWCAGVTLSFIAGRTLSSADSKDTPQGNIHAQHGLRLHEQAMRERLKLASDADDLTEAALALGEDADAARAQLHSQSGERTRRLLEAAFALPLSDPRRSEVIHDLLKQLATSDPLAALELAAGIASLRDAERARTDILEVWASNEPMAALAWANEALADVPTNLRNSQMRAILRGFAETNPTGAFQYASALDDSTATAMRLKNHLLGEVIETQIRGGGLQDAQTTIALMEEGPTKNSLQRELVNEWAAFDPESAAAYVKSLGDDAPTSLKTTLIAEWAENDPAAAAAWLSALPKDDPAFAQATATITREWTRYDLTASSEWLNSLPASPELDRAIATYTFRATQEDPATAMSWAESINNDTMRNKMMQQVAGNWKNEDPETFTAYLDNGDFSQAQRKLLESAKTWHGPGAGSGWHRKHRGQ
jgi:hypothetical protein